MPKNKKSGKSVATKFSIQSILPSTSKTDKSGIIADSGDLNLLTKVINSPDKMSGLPQSALTANLNTNFPNAVAGISGTGRLSIRPTVDIMTISAAEILLSGGKNLRMNVVKNGGMRIQGAEQQLFIARYEPTQHTANDTSLKRLQAAAGIYLAGICRTTAHTRQIENSLAIGQGVQNFYNISPELYYLYNPGLEYELETKEFQGQVIALMAWKIKYAAQIYKASDRDAALDFRAAVVHFENTYKTDSDWANAAMTAKPFIDSIKNIPPSMSGGRAARAQMYHDKFVKFIMPLMN